MAIPLVPVMFAVIAGKIVTINFEVYRKVKARSLDRVNTIELIDEQVNELSKALGGKAGKEAQVEIDRLNALKAQILESNNESDYTLDDYFDDMADAAGETVNDVRRFVNKVCTAVSGKISRFQDKVGSFENGSEQDK